MKKINTYKITMQIVMIIFIFLISNLMMAQTECSEPNAGAFIEINNVKAWINNNQLQFYDGELGTYEVPTGSGLITFFATNLWIGGETPDGQLKIAADTYGVDGSRFLPGPLNDNGLVDEDLCDTYNRLYIVTREMSETHALYFQAIENGTLDEDFPDGYQLPQVLLDYPGSIYTSTGLNEHGAPYHDYNEDGLYDATQGDFPLFSGMNGEFECQSCETLNGDICFYWINNDMKNFEDQSPIGIEIHNMVYAFASDYAINNTIFFQKKIINRGSQTLSNTHIGIYADPDLGCYEDDYSACDVSRNLGIVMNSDEYDGDCGVLGYGDSPPSAGIIGLTTPVEYNDLGELLAVNMSGFTSFNILIQFPQTVPINAVQYNNSMNNLWQNGEPMTYGGTGIGGSQTASYMFPHDTDPVGIGTGGVPQDSWSEIEESNGEGDRRFLMSFGPFTMEPGEVNCMTYATIYAANDGDENPLNAIQMVADEVSELYQGCFEDIINGIDEYDEEEIAIVHWDVSNSVLKVTANDHEKLTILVIDETGRLVKSLELNREQLINLSDVASGMYVVNVVNQKGTKQSEKIVKL